MKHIRSLFKLTAISFLVIQPFFTLPAYAAGFQINEISPSLQGDATAGAAAADNDVSAMFINPATLSKLNQNQAYIGASEIFPHISMSNATAIHTVNVPGNPPSNITAPVAGVNSQTNISRPVFVPDAYFGYRINDYAVFGLAVLAPFGLSTKYYDNSVVRFMADNSSVTTVNLTPAIAFQLNKQWSAGVGFQVQHISAVFSNFNGPYTGIAPIDALVASSHPTYLTASGWGYGYTLGLMFQPDQVTRLGVGFRSQVSNQVSGNGQQYTSPGGVVPAPNANFLFNAQTSVGAAIKTPAILTLSAARDINDWTVKATAQVNFWDSFNHLSIDMPQAFGVNSTIQTQWSNAWFAALGADYRLRQSWVLRAGVAYDQTPTNNTYRDARIPDSDRYWLTLGATYMATKHFSIDGAYAHIFTPNQTINLAQASGNSATSTLPLEVNTVTANYRGSIDIVALALRYSF